MLASATPGLDLIRAVERLSFDFSAERAQSGLPQELGSLFENSGKRFRPALCFLFGQVFGVTEETLLPYARAVEMTHTASLVHDDVIDAATQRRQFPTLNHRFGNTTAVLAGDFLLAKVIGDLSREAGNLELITDLTDAIKDLADGEWLQHRLKTRFEAGRADLEAVASKKTGALMVWACVTPAKLARRPEGELRACRELGDGIGVFFQMLDDVNDFNPRSGKPLAQDLHNGQLNFVTSTLLSRQPHLRDALKEFPRHGKFPPGAEVQQAIDVVVEDSRQLEARLNSLFAGLAEGCSPASIPVFAKMLAKVREGFTPA